MVSCATTSAPPEPTSSQSGQEAIPKEPWPAPHADVQSAPPVQCPEPKSETPLANAPTISSVTQSVAPDGSIIFTIKGSGIDNGTILEIHTASGKRIGNDTVFEKISDPVQTAITKPITDVGAGKYNIILKNSAGQYSQESKVTIHEAKVRIPEAKVTIRKESLPKSTEQCSGEFSKKPHVLYLGGGEAEEVFKRYLSHNAGVDKTLPRDIKIKFYEKKETDNLSLQTIALNDMEQMFVESQEDFFNKIQKRLKGRVATPTSLLVDDASREKADYCQCTGLPLATGTSNGKK